VSRLPISRCLHSRGQATRLLAALVGFVLLQGANVAPALILDAGDGQGNTDPPPDDPGWSHVGHHLGGPSVIYLGNRWVLTADHVGASIVFIQGRRFNPVAGSLVQLHRELTDVEESKSAETRQEGSEENSEEPRRSDLLLFRIDGDPGLPILPIAALTPKIGENALLIAGGSSRGPRVSLYSPGLAIRDGFHWHQDDTMRWGSNLVDRGPTWVEHQDTNTRAFPLVFDRLEDRNSTPDEAAAGLGDSGGAVFTRANPILPETGWVLSGLLFSVASDFSQPPETTFYGNITWVADLSHYREEIRRHVWPKCEDRDPRRGLAPDCSALRFPDSQSMSRIMALAGASGLLLVFLWMLIRRRGGEASQPER
jgi:hypothetical protein